MKHSSLLKYTPLFVTGIGTNIGKTIVSAVLTEQLKADYWKPVQAGGLEQTDTDQVRSLISNSKSVIHPEAFRLNLAASPHKAARYDGISINPADFQLPQTDNLLVIEGAGGLMVPLSNSFLMIDLITLFKAEVIVVISNYLGCINHTLLTLYTLQHKGLSVKHIVLNGDFDEDTESVLIHHFPEGATYSRMPALAEISRATILNIPKLIDQSK